MNKIKSLFREPSSYAGIALVLNGVSQLTNRPEIAIAADTVQQAGQTVEASGGNITLALGTILAGLFAFFMREGGKGESPARPIR